MAKIDTIQTSFVGGEFAPALFGRTDIAQYENACEIVENLLVRPYGSVISTPGTEFINDCKYTEVSGNDDNTYLLVRADGIEGSKVFTDASFRNHTVRAVGKAKVSTAQKKFGTGSLLPGIPSPTNSTPISLVDNSSYHRTVTAFGQSVLSSTGSLATPFKPSIRFDGAADYLQIPNSEDFNFGTEDFTIEFTARSLGASLPSSAGLVTYITNVSNYWAVCLSGSNMVFKVVEAGVETVNVTWPHSWAGNETSWMSFVKSSGTLSYFIGGVLISSSTLAATAIPVTTSNFQDNVLKIGRFDGSTLLDFNGWIDELRISKGIPRYTANYTPTTSKFYNDPYTLLLLHMGDGGYLQIPDSDDWYFNGIDFTIDFWAYFNSLPAGSSDPQCFMSQKISAGSATNDWVLFKDSGLHKISATFSGSTIATMMVTNTTLLTNVWTHFAFVTVGTGCTLYIQGVSQGTYNIINAGNIPNVSGDLIIGAKATTDDSHLDGYLDEFRISRVARWTADFTPSTIAYDDPEDITVTRNYGKARLIPFIFSRSDAYIIEVGEGYFRFYTDGAVVISSGSTVLEITHTYTVDEIFDIQYAQINDVIYLSHPNHIPKRLTRIASNNWTFTDFPFIGGPFAGDNIIYSGGTTSVLSSATISASVITSGSSATLSASANVFIASSSTLGHVNTYWKIGATVTNGTTGLTEQGYVKITAITNPSTATATVMKNIVSTVATTTWAQGSWSDVLGWPARTTLHQQRLFMARTDFQPQNVWGSKSFVFEDFALDGGEDDDAIDIQLASNESNEIKWLSPGQSLLAGTYGGEFNIHSGDSSPLTPSNTNVSKETSWGSEAVVPKKIGNFLYYIQRFGRKIRELFFNFDLNGYKSVDKTILSPHISGDGFIDVTYQQNPDTILWAVCSNGTIATMTREIDQEVTSWSRQTTDGLYESIASIPSQDGPHDEIWVVVNRTINGNNRRYIERFKSQLVPDRKDQCFYVHSGLTYDAFNETADPPISMSVSATSGTIVVSSSAAYFNSNDVGQRVRAIDSDGNTVGEASITGYTSSTIVIGTVNTTFDSNNYAAGEWGVSVNALSGFDHLEAEDLTALGDGGTDGSLKTVSDGTITLNNDYFVVNAGLPYTQILKTIPQEAGSQRGTSQGKIQRINEVGFKVNRSHRGFFVGGSNDLLERVRFRDASTLMGSSEDLFTGTIPNISFRDDYRYGSQVLIQNSDPLPIELLSVITSIDTNDK